MDYLDPEVIEALNSFTLELRLRKVGWLPGLPPPTDTRYAEKVWLALRLIRSSLFQHGIITLSKESPITIPGCLFTATMPELPDVGPLIKEYTPVALCPVCELMVTNVILALNLSGRDNWITPLPIKTAPDYQDRLQAAYRYICSERFQSHLHSITPLKQKITQPPKLKGQIQGNEDKFLERLPDDPPGKVGLKTLHGIFRRFRGHG